MRTWPDTQNIAPTITSVTNSGPIDEGDSATITVEATDPAGASDPLSYEFDCDNDGSFEVGPQPGNAATCGFADNGSFPVNVRVTDDDDGEATGSTTVEVQNVAPTADAGPDQTVYRNDLASVSGTWTDPASSLDEPCTWSWNLDGDGTPDSGGVASYGDAITEMTSFAPEGFYTVTFQVTDKDGDTGSDALVIEVLNQPPVCTDAVPSIDTLWPPNHEFVAVDVLGVTDPEGDPISIIIDSILQDEPVDTEGDGSFTPDGQGVGTPTAEVRAERVGSGNGRFYHISFTADDEHGGICSGEVLVGVPKSQDKKGAPVDDGPLHDSTALAP